MKGKILDKIIENKKVEVKIMKKKFPLDSFKHKLKVSERNFKKALSKNKLCLIAEIKRSSPSKNITQKRFDIKKIMKVYNKYADAVSVLTDKKFFGGSLSDLKVASELTNLPILRKDFIVDEYQIYESRFYNADAILLIASVLSIGQINRFIDIAESCSMECLVEAHTEEELDRILNSNADIIGINNRNLDTLKIDTETTLRLAGKVPEGKIIVSESGITSKEYARKISGKVNAILVGSLFMNSKNLEKEICSLIK